MGIFKGILGALALALGFIFNALGWKVRGARRTRKQYLALARDLGLDEDQVLTRTFNRGSAPTATAPSLVIIALRPGPWKQVLRNVTAGAETAGYYDPRPPQVELQHPPGMGGHGQWSPATFRPPRGQRLPALHASFFVPGQTIESTDTAVPDGYTGLLFKLGT